MNKGCIAGLCGACAGTCAEPPRQLACFASVRGKDCLALDPAEDSIDMMGIEAHLLGDIPNRDIDDLGKYWQVFQTLKSDLFMASERPEFSSLKIEQATVKDTIYNHPEFVSYANEFNTIFRDWRKRYTPVLKNIAAEFCQLHIDIPSRL